MESSYSYSYPMGDADRQGNLTRPAMVATNGVASGFRGETITLEGGGVTGGVAAAGNGGDGDGDGDDGMLEFGGILNAEEEDDDEDTGPEPCYVFSVPDWETIKAGVSSPLLFFQTLTSNMKKIRRLMFCGIWCILPCYYYFHRSGALPTRPLISYSLIQFRDFFSPC